MRNKHTPNNKHIVDTLFVLTLFAVFAVCSMLLIAFGANIYQKTINNVDEHFNLSTSVTYVSEKLRHGDDSGAIDVIPFGDSNAFRISTTIDGITYYTYIYQNDGYLKELYTKSDNSLGPNAGQKLLPISEFVISEQSDGLYSYTITDLSNSSMNMKICLKTDKY